MKKFMLLGLIFISSMYGMDDSDGTKDINTTQKSSCKARRKKYRHKPMTHYANLNLIPSSDDMEQSKRLAEMKQALADVKKFKPLLKTLCLLTSCAEHVNKQPTCKICDEAHTISVYAQGMNDPIEYIHKRLLYVIDVQETKNNN